jgi:hypothetical protein
MFKIIVAGGRTFSDYVLLEKTINQFVYENDNIKDFEIVSGTANGADKLGEQFAKNHGYPVKRFPADWNTFGKRAGYIRNEQMAKYSNALIAFWDGQSKGTKHMIDLAEENDLEVCVIKY